MTMFREFLAHQGDRLQWAEPETADAALKAYLAGYLGGYIAEQVVLGAVVRVTTVAKAGKFLGTVMGWARKGEAMLGVAPHPKAVGATAFNLGMAKVHDTPTNIRATRHAAAANNGRVPKVGDFSSDLAQSRTDVDWARKRLAARLGTRGTGNQAHHLIPLSLASHPLVQKAARGGFDINGKHNGKPMKRQEHQAVEGHPRYNDGVESVLDQHRNAPGNFNHLSDEEAAWILLEIAEKTSQDIDRALSVGGGLTKVADPVPRNWFVEVHDLGASAAIFGQRPEQQGTPTAFPMLPALSFFRLGNCVERLNLVEA